ncbi:hypothetical protein VNI00_003524 [Paramarasmius palmivorus]|uniref:Uncharacterized protein n=1 Tax=Paramarasmius palmivorus TaxID=297713 RepID=A0AAW0DTJ5_9AGAR
MPFQTSNMSAFNENLLKTTWHVSVISTAKELTMASAIYSASAVEKGVDAVEGPARGTPSGSIMGWVPQQEEYEGVEVCEVDGERRSSLGGVLKGRAPGDDSGSVEVGDVLTAEEIKNEDSLLYSPSESLDWLPSEDSLDSLASADSFDSDLSDYYEEVIYIQPPRQPARQPARKLYTILEEDEGNACRDLYTIFEEDGVEAGCLDDGESSMDVDGDEEAGECCVRVGYEEFFDLDEYMDEHDENDDGDDVSEEGEDVLMSEHEIEGMLTMALQLVMPSKAANESNVEVYDWDEALDESSLSMSSTLTWTDMAGPSRDTSLSEDISIDLGEIFATGAHEHSFRMPEPCDVFGADVGGDVDQDCGWLEGDASFCKPLQLKPFNMDKAATSSEEEVEDWDEAFDESLVPGTPVVIHKACPDVISIPFKSAVERMKAWKGLLSTLGGIEDVDNLLKPVATA